MDAGVHGPSFPHRRNSRYRHLGGSQGLHRAPKVGILRKKKAHQSRRVSSLLVGLYPITEHERRKSVQISVVLSVGTFG